MDALKDACRTSGDYPAYIQQSNGILRTSPIVGIGSLSPYELQFETQNTRYTLNILTADELCRPNGGQPA